MANEYTFSGQTGKEEGKPKDVDLDHDSPHHTLGRGPLQAASGVHTHTVSEIQDMPSEGLPHNHDAAYSVLAHTHAAVTNADTVDNQHLNWDDRAAISTYLWGVTNYGDGHLVASSRLATAGHTHASAPYATSAGNADTVDGQHFAWSDPGTWPTYMWVANSNGSGFLLAASKVPRVFVQAGTPTGQKVGDIWVTP